MSSHGAHMVACNNVCPIWSDDIQEKRPPLDELMKQDIRRFGGYYIVLLKYLGDYQNEYNLILNDCKTFEDERYADAKRIYDMISAHFNKIREYQMDPW
jgi:hypothetical protein